MNETQLTPFEHGIYTIYYSGPSFDAEEDGFHLREISYIIETYASLAVFTNTSTEKCFSFKIENVDSAVVPVWALIQEINKEYTPAAASEFASVAASANQVIKKMTFTKSSVSITMDIHPFAQYDEYDECDECVK